MPRIIVLSLVALLAVFLVARSCGLTPEQRADRMILAELNAEEGERYRSLNRQREGVVTLADDLQVELLHQGDGPTPGADDLVAVHYRGRHLDGREFDSSYRRDEPSVIPVERTIPGWRRVLVELPVGSRVRLVVPPQLAYGAAGAGLIGPEETLIFELELLAIVVPGEAPEHDPLQDAVPGLR
jgi:FKBP-type peptidyl-prolyl cis-trans isomerase FkpA